MRASLVIPFFFLAASITPSFAFSLKPDRPAGVARAGAGAGGEAAEAVVETAAKGAGKSLNYKALKEAALTNVVAATGATGLGIASHVFLPLSEKQRRDVFELLEDRVNQELSAREYRRDLLMTLLDNLD